MVITPGMMKTLTKSSSKNNANSNNNNPIYGFGQMVNDLSGQNAAMDRQYNQNVEIAKNQYQWAVEDMKHAGLNPAMMFSGGGHTAATSVGQGQGSLGNVASAINSVAKLINANDNTKNKSSQKVIYNAAGKILKTIIMS